MFFWIFFFQKARVHDYMLLNKAVNTIEILKKVAA